MNVAVAMFASLGVLGVGYLLYGRLVGRLVGVDEKQPTPAVTINDGVDYVPTKPLVLFGHHFASIAAAGPIVGPTLAIIYGYIPTWLWIVLGVIFIGAVHDFTALFISVRAGGKSVAEVARQTLGKTGFILFVAFALLLCILVTAAFLQLTARALTSVHSLEGLGLPPNQTLLQPALTEDGKPGGVLGGIASTSVVIITLLAPLLGYLIYRRGAPVTVMSGIALAVCLGSVFIGFQFPIRLDPTVWMVIILAYTLFAAWIPVWLILQPRDFVNVHLLYIGLLFMIAGLIGAGLHGATIQAPAFNASTTPDGALESFRALGLLWPFMFVTVACGACSGAHALVAGGTTCKQLANERHAPVIGYGGMLLEAVLGLCVTLMLVGGLGFVEYSQLVWPRDEHGALVQGNAPLAFALSVGKTLTKGLGISTVYGTIFGILLLEGFLITTIDTVIRLARYLFEELWQALLAKPPALLTNRFFNVALTIALVTVVTFTNGWRAIWPVFGTANQLLAALTFIAATAWLLSQKRPAWFTAIPALFMVATTGTALVLLLQKDIFGDRRQWVLGVTEVLLLLLALGVVAMGVRYVLHLRAAAPAAATAGGDGGG